MSASDPGAPIRRWTDAGQLKSTDLPVYNTGCLDGEAKVHPHDPSPGPCGEDSMHTHQLGRPAH
jgi:hypothetical protein